MCSESQHENKMAGAMQVLITVQTPIFHLVVNLLYMCEDI